MGPRETACQTLRAGQPVAVARGEYDRGGVKGQGFGGEPSQQASHPDPTSSYMAADAPNDVWNIDYKGWFRCGDGDRVDPLTMSDGCSRYLLRCQHVERTGYELTKPVFD